MVAQGFTFGHAATPASYCFFIITGFHALHLLFGVVALAASLVTLGYLRNVEFRQIAVDSLAWFWHAMGFAWIILFGVLTFG
jgi:cytochrome c oxidase subunit 3